MTAEKAEPQDAAETVSEKEKEMDIGEVFQFMNRESFAVLATVGDNGQPQATVMGLAVTRELEIVCDTARLRAKYANSKKNPRVAWVIGCTTEVAAQYEGSAREFEEEELARYQQTYFAKFTGEPERLTWPGITYFVVHPKCVRYCDYNPGTRRIEEKAF